MIGSNQIKKLFISQKKYRRENHRKPILKSVDQYKQVLVLSDKDESQDNKLLQDHFKNATISYLYPRLEKEDSTQAGIYSYHLFDLNLTGKIKNDKLNKLLQTEFDLILDLSTDNAINSWFLKKLKSTFNIGYSESEKSEFYDLLINKNQAANAFIETITQQITLLSQNGNK